MKKNPANGGQTVSVPLKQRKGDGNTVTKPTSPADLKLPGQPTAGGKIH